MITRDQTFYVFTVGNSVLSSDRTNIIRDKIFLRSLTTKFINLLQANYVQ